MPLTRIKSRSLANTESFTFGAANITGNLTVSSVTDLGAVGNVKITGGTADYGLRTDGSGNLSWVAQTGGGGGGADQYARDTANAAFIQALMRLLFRRILHIMQPILPVEEEFLLVKL